MSLSKDDLNYGCTPNNHKIKKVCNSSDQSFET